MQDVTRFAGILRWGARLLSGIIIAFWGFFLLAHLFGSAGSPSRPLVSADYLMLGALLISLTGLLLAWKWEAAGALITLVAFGIIAAVNWRVVIFPGTLIPITAILFLIAWQLGKNSPTRNAMLGKG